MVAISHVDVVSFRQKLAARSLPPYRFADGKEICWQDSPAGSDKSLQRFLFARQNNLAHAETMFADHLTWRRRCFPIRREGKVAELLDDGSRFQRVGTSEDGRPVLMIHFLWGYFLQGDIRSEDCLRAAVLFADTEMAAAEAAGQHEVYIIAYGGPPPLAFGAALASILQANYPERLYRAMIYPVHKAIARFVRMMLWIMDSKTQGKVSIEWSENELLKCMNLRLEQLPSFMRGGLPAAEGQFRPDSKQRMTDLIRNGILGGKRAGIELQESILREPADVASPYVQDSPRNRTSLFCGFCCMARENDRENDLSLACSPSTAEATPDATKQVQAQDTHVEARRVYQTICSFLLLNITLSLLMFSMMGLWRCTHLHSDCKPLSMTLWESFVRIVAQMESQLPRR